MNDIPIHSIAALVARTSAGTLRPREIAAEVLLRLDASSHEHVWITRVSDDALLARADALDRLGPSADRPLHGVPFAVKDNIDVGGLPTTAACPEFAYTPATGGTVVDKLLRAGAMLVGKTNLDQFATGLNGTRSPHGAPRCVFDRDYVSGGSSSGSAVAVAAGLVSFSLGTDTAGSGRVPAAFNNLVGLKPTRGRVSTRGVVPACRSLDCVSIFTATVEDAATVLAATEGFDADDLFSRKIPAGAGAIRAGDARVAAAKQSPFSFGVPREDQLKFFGDTAAAVLYAAALDRLEAIGGRRVVIDYAPFDAAAKLLYGGAFVAERTAAVGAFLAARPEAGHPVVRQIVESGSRFSAADAFAAIYKLAALRRRADAVWDVIDVLVLPTAGTIYRVDAMLADPVTLNANLGYYTNF
ncbi:MAG TPA: allophanate hydrolase, partial [Tepidisphaeraceae bacterium]